MFLWLLVAFAVDGLDGPLARATRVTDNARRLDGTILDVIVDFLTYVVIPAFALFHSDLLPGWTGWVAIIVITFLSAIYFADTRMKTSDNSFNGFPACWNMVVLVLFAIKPDFWISLTLVVALAVAMLLPIKFVHPFRTVRWRTISLPMAFAWTFFAGWPLGWISTPKAGALGPDHHDGLAAVRGRHAASPVPRKALNLALPARVGAQTYLSSNATQSRGSGPL